jgi:hypothetical protein
MIGIAVVVFVEVISIPGYQAKIRYSRESVLQLNLVAMRTVINYYLQDKHRPPQSSTVPPRSSQCGLLPRTAHRSHDEFELILET